MRYSLLMETRIVDLLLAQVSDGVIDAFVIRYCEWVLGIAADGVLLVYREDAVPVMLGYRVGNVGGIKRFPLVHGPYP